MFKEGQKVRIKHAPEGVDPHVYFHDWVADMTQFCGTTFTVKGKSHPAKGDIYFVEGGPEGWVWYSDALELVDESPMHENNLKVINCYKPSDLAHLYREYINGAFSVLGWASTFLPEGVTMEQAVALKELCEACHNMGL